MAVCWYNTNEPLFSCKNSGSPKRQPFIIDCRIQKMEVFPMSIINRHRPRLLRHQNSALFISGWTYQLRRTRTLHPPRTLRVWRVLFCLWLRAAAYPAGQDRKRQLLPADTGSDCKRNPAARLAARMFCADCGGSAADQFRTRQTQVQRLSAAEQSAREFQIRGCGVQHYD